MTKFLGDAGALPVTKNHQLAICKALSVPSNRTWNKKTNHLRYCTGSTLRTFRTSSKNIPCPPASIIVKLLLFDLLSKSLQGLLLDGVSRSVTRLVLADIISSCCVRSLSLSLTTVCNDKDNKEMTATAKQEVPHTMESCGKLDTFQ